MTPPKRECRACGAPITFARHYATNRSSPLQPDPEGRWELDGSVYLPADDKTPAGKRYTSHFATCPARERVRAQAAQPRTTTRR